MKWWLLLFSLAVLTACAQQAERDTPQQIHNPVHPADLTYDQRAAIDTATEAILSLYDRASVLLIGEYHGTEEIPALVGAVARRLADEGPVTVALEIPVQEQAGIDTFLDSDGGPAALGALLAGEFWRIPRDGRRSQATVRLLDTIRTLRAHGIPLEVATIDDGAFFSDGIDRFQGMADAIAALADRPGQVVVMIGNYHARLVPFSDAVRSSDGAIIEPPLPTAARITNVPMTSVNVTACKGHFWACKDDDCGPITLTNRCDGTQMRVESELDRNRYGYDVIVILGRLTVAPPACTFSSAIACDPKRP